jgi:uncharacterized membrane protein YqaE (UPF0057 family)
MGSDAPHGIIRPGELTRRAASMDACRWQPGIIDPMSKGHRMRYALAILLPPVVFFTMGKPFQGILNLILMITLIGWPIAAIWALIVVSSYHGDQNRMRVVKALDAQTAAIAAQTAALADAQTSAIEAQTAAIEARTARMADSGSPQP